MKTDRELLELAAKAVLFDIDFNEPLDNWYPNGYDENGNVKTWWNPLIDDGDALRLAVKLHMDIEMHGTAHVFDFVHALANKGEIQCEEECSNGDQCAAIRRAIVRAAAAIQQSKGQ